MVFLEESAWKNWDKSGRQDFTKAFQCLLPSDKSSLDDSSKLNEIRKAIHELLWKCLRGHLKRDQTIQTIGELTTFHNELGSVIIDTLALVDIETSMLNNEKEREEVRERSVIITYRARKFKKVQAQKLVKSNSNQFHGIFVSIFPMKST